MAEVGVRPFFDTLIDNHVLFNSAGRPANIFSFYLSTNQVDQSELIFGGWDNARIKHGHEIVWHPVEDKLFWSIKLDDIKVGGKSLGICNEHTNCTMTPDSGTSQLTMPGWAHKIWKGTEWSKAYSCGQHGEQERPELTFVMNGHEYPIPSHHWNERAVLSKENLDSGICGSTIGELTIHQQGQQNLFIIGDAFMQVYYSIFDRDNDQVGLVMAHHETPEQLATFTKTGYLANTELVDQY